MIKRSSKVKLSRSKSHTKALIINQMRSIFKYGYVKTTTAKAKALKQQVSIFLNKAKEESLANQRYMQSILGKKELVAKAKEYVSKTDSKVSIIKVSFRDGDSAEMSKVTLLGYEELFGKGKKKKAVSGKATKIGKESLEDEKLEFKEEKSPTEKGFVNKLNADIKGKFIKKERARSRSGL